jgi:transcriptional regulator with XRE-family HTH domain
MNMTLGEKIKFYRKRAGLSQLELETSIEASPGSLSRIENDQINPTKETILKIIEVLHLSTSESGNLFGITIEDISSIKLLKAAKNITSSLDLNSIMQNAVNEIVNELNFFAGFIVLVKDNRIYSQTASQNLPTKVALKFLPSPINTLYVDLIEDSSNLMVQSILQKKAMIADNLESFIVPAVSLTVCRLIEKVTNTKSGIAMPIVVGESCIGALYFNKTYIHDFKDEFEAIQQFAEYLGVAINNAREHEALKTKLGFTNAK